MNADMIVGWTATGTPIHRPRITPRLDALRKRFWSVLAVNAAVDGDQDTMQHVADAIGLDEQAAEFLSLCLDSAIRADSFLRSAFTSERLDAMVRDRALALIDATDTIVCTAQQEESTT